MGWFHEVLAKDSVKRGVMEVGAPVLQAPHPISIPDTVRAGYIRDHIKISKLCLEVGDQTVVPVWAIAAGLGTDSKKIVEIALVSMGLELIYEKASKFSKRGRGLRRCVIIDHSKIRAYRKEVKKYLKKSKGDG